MADTLASKNEAYWNAASQKVFKDQWVQDLQNQISEFLTANGAWIGVPVPSKDDSQPPKMMDYGCGNGIISRALHNHFSKFIGIDLSDGMLEEYRSTAAELGLDESRMQAVQGDLLAPTVQPTRPPLSEEELGGFDLVAICMALHHVEDIQLATKRLAERLRPGGVLLIIDWATRDSSKDAGSTEEMNMSNADHQHHPDSHSHEQDSIHPEHPAAGIIAHDNFSQGQIFSLFEQAGCGEPQFVLADRLTPVPDSRSGQMQLFWARATKL